MRERLMPLGVMPKNVFVCLLPNYITLKLITYFKTIPNNRNLIYLLKFPSRKLWLLSYLLLNFFNLYGRTDFQCL